MDPRYYPYSAPPPSNPHSEYEINPYPPSSDLFYSSMSGKSSNGGPVIVSNSSTARMKVYGSPNDPQQTRHARRIYVGSIPPNYIDEDGIRNFFNSVVAQGLGEENDHSYVVSVYIDLRKCFSFVELKSIELAAACLELNGIVFKQIVLRILRANEFKPELLRNNLMMMNLKPIRLNLAGLHFGNLNASSNPMMEEDMDPSGKTIDSLIHYAQLQDLKIGSVVLVGFPFCPTNPSAPTLSMSPSNVPNRMINVPVPTIQNAAQTPKLFRNFLRKYRYGQVINLEHNVDLSGLDIIDVGDVVADTTASAATPTHAQQQQQQQAGLLEKIHSAKTNLTITISHLVAQGAIPFVLGGNNDLLASSCKGVGEVLGHGNVVHIVIGSHVEVKYLHEFHSLQQYSSVAASPFVLFGAQVILLLYVILCCMM